MQRQKVVLRVEYANTATVWWRALEATLDTRPQAVPEPMRLLAAHGDGVAVSMAEARTALQWAAALPGWRGGPPRAPHPLRIDPAS